MTDNGKGEMPADMSIADASRCSQMTDRDELGMLVMSLKELKRSNSKLTNQTKKKIDALDRQTRDLQKQLSYANQECVRERQLKEDALYELSKSREDLENVCGLAQERKNERCKMAKNFDQHHLVERVVHLTADKEQLQDTISRLQCMT